MFLFALVASFDNSLGKARAAVPLSFGVAAS